MKQKLKVKLRLLSIIMALVMTVVFSPVLCLAVTEKNGLVKLENEDQYKVALQSNNLSLAINTADGGIIVSDNIANIAFRSNPADIKNNVKIKGSNAMEARSQLILVLADNIGNQTVVNSAVASVNKSGLTVFKGEDLVKVVYNFPEYNIEVPVTYSFENGTFNAAIDAVNIKSEDKDLVLREIRLLPYFGAAEAKDDGYFIVPDGCGAVIDFHSRKTPAYRQSLFGNDLGRVYENTLSIMQPALLPMVAASYRLHDGTSVGLVEYVEEGASLASANADAETNDGCYNVAYFSFKYRDYDEVTFMNQTSSAQKVNMNEKNHTACKVFKVSYSILPGQNDLVSLAEKVRERVFDGKVPSKIQSNELPVYIRIFMSVRKTKYFLGIPYNGNQKLTDFNDCNDIFDSFKKTPVVMSLIGMDSDGAIGGRIDNSIRIKSSLGNMKELKKFMDAVQNDGGAVYPSAQFTEFTKGNGSNRVKSVAGLTISRNFFDLGTTEENENYNSLYILKGQSVLKNVNSWIKSALRNNIAYCAPVSLSNSPYRSGVNLGEDRESTKQLFEESLIRFYKNNIKLLSESAASYAIPYSEHIRSMPVSSSGFTACNYEVPFLQIVLHGIKSYSLPSINLSGDWENYFLKAIETGSSLDFSFIGSDYDEIKGTALDYLNGASFSLCKEKSIEFADKLSQSMSGTANSLIDDYRVITQQVRAVAYENGDCYIVNYGNSDYDFNGLIIKAKGFEKTNREVLK